MRESREHCTPRTEPGHFHSPPFLPRNAQRKHECPLPPTPPPASPATYEHFGAAGWAPRHRVSQACGREAGLRAECAQASIGFRRIVGVWGKWPGRLLQSEKRARSGMEARAPRRPRRPGVRAEFSSPGGRRLGRSRSARLQQNGSASPSKALRAGPAKGAFL